MAVVSGAISGVNVAVVDAGEGLPAALGSGGLPAQPFRNKAPVAVAAEVSKNLRRLNEPITLIDIFYEKRQTEK
jgi:hypothetical protein